MTRPQHHAASLPSVREVLEARPDVVLAYAFGSAGAGTLSEESDLDVAVLARAPLSADERRGLIRDLGDATGRPVDLVDLRRAGVPLLQEILGKGSELLCRDQEAKERLIVRMLIEVEDFLPLRRRLLEERRNRWLGTS